MTYYYKKKHSSLWRSAQIAQGVMDNSCEEDELFIEKIGDTNPNNNQVHIFDARPHISAYANRAKGGGLEKESNYKNSKVIFGGVEGITSVQSAYKSLMKTCRSRSKLSHSNFLSKVESSGWYKLIRKQIIFAVKAAHILHEEKENVLVH